MRQEKIEVIWTADPAIDHERMSVAELVDYVKTRDSRKLKLKPGQKPTRFVVREIPRRLFFSYVMSVATEEERAMRAFLVGVESAHDVKQEDDSYLLDWKGSGLMDGIEVVKEEELSRFSPAEILEVGTAAYYHSFLPRRIDDCLRAPPTSFDLWTALGFRPADASPTSAAPNNEEPSGSTTPTPDETGTGTETSAESSGSPTPATAQETAA